MIAEKCSFFPFLFSFCIYLRVQGVILVCHQLVDVQQCLHIRAARCVVCWQGCVNIPLMLFRGLGKTCHILKTTVEALPKVWGS